MKTYQGIFFINLFIFSCIYTNPLEATPLITWEIKEGSSNLSFLHRGEDLSILIPKISKNNEIESAYDQYLKLFTPPSSNNKKSRDENPEYKKYIETLKSIVTNHWVTDWNNDTNRYRSTYATPCNNYVTSAFCQEITLKISNPPYKYCLWIIGDQEPAIDSCKQHSTTIPIDNDIAVTAQPINNSNQKIETSVRVDGKVILALGDSFASGEGNPDQPAIHRDSIPIEGSGYNFFLSRGDGWQDSLLKDGPLWLNRTCHRSLLSYQFKVALQYAAENPKERVVFASFSCSGAEITQGLLQHQTKLPYEDGGVPIWSVLEMSQFQITEPEMSQLDMAMRFLCGDMKMNDDGTIIVCKDYSKFREPDLILLSIGGNDIGFGALILDAFSPIFQILPNITLPVPDPLKAAMRVLGVYKSPEQAKTIIDTQLSDLYKKLHNGLLDRKLIKTDNKPNKIIQTNYPNLVQNCDKDWNKNGNYGFINITNPEFNSLGARGGKFLLDLESRIRWLKEWFDNSIDMSISEQESIMLTKLIENLQNVIDENKNKLGWEVIKLNNNEIKEHGICALDKEYESSALDRDKAAQKTFKFPNREMNKGNISKWKDDFKPSDWFFYLPERKRWFNMIDDSVMKLATRYCPDSWQTQPACKEMLMGAIHPDLAYHARIADEVYKAAKEILSN